MNVNRRDFIKVASAAAGAAAMRGAHGAEGRTRIPVRMFWSWDQSTNWCENVDGSQTTGVGNAYTKNIPWRFFVWDYKRVVDWCAAHDMQAVGIVGLLRDRHGGIDAVRKLCAYANSKGVKIYIIGGLFAYGGAYYEGKSKWSLDRFLEDNKDCMARKADGTPHYARFLDHGGTKVEPQGCPSSQKLKDYVIESYSWLFKTIPELGGIQMEAGDNGVCQCPTCKERRGKKAAKEYMSLEDMAGIYPQVAAAVRSQNKDALIICETYHHFLDKACGIFYENPPGKDAKALFDMPKDIYWQWKCDRMLEADTWPEKAALPPEMAKFHNVMRSHAGTQWWGGRDSFDVEKIRRQCRLSFLSGLDAVSMFGEVSPFNTNAEFNYLALQYFSDNPLYSMDDFAKNVMSPLLGGDGQAADWIRWARLEHEPEKIPEASAAIARIAADSVSKPEIRRRWTHLAHRLDSFYWEWERNGRQSPVYCNHPVPMKSKAKDSPDHL
jgi:hypothetical protein